MKKPSAVTSGKVFLNWTIIGRLTPFELNQSNPTINTLIKILDILGYELFINLKS